LFLSIMTDMSSYFEDIVQNWWSQNDDMPTAPSNVYVSLHTSDEGNTPDGTDEVGEDSYSRVETAPADWSVSGDGPTTVENEETINFGDPEENWGNVSHFAIWDGSSDTDNPLTATIPLDEAKDITSDTDEVRFDTSALTIELD